VKIFSIWQLLRQDATARSHSVYKAMYILHLLLREKGYS
jgi:hypothetical protein